MSRKNWQKQITVDRRIVRLLSSSTYEDFPGAIKEMVSNAYDADATRVDINIDLKNDTITVSDDGNGMTPEEFDFFLRIAGQQRERKISPEFRRRRIGQFGIGFMAIFPFGKRIKVTSTARRSAIQFEATIPTESFIEREGISINVEDIKIPGYQVEDQKFIGEHGTQIQISGLTQMVKNYFQKRNMKDKKPTIRLWSPMDKLEWMLKEDLPLDYPLDSSYREAFKDLGTAGLKVWLNSKQLFRNIYGSHILEDELWEYNNIKCRYIISTDWKSVSPYEARHLKLRLRNVGVGERNPFGLGTEGRTYSRLHWLTGEIHILEGFDDLITIDRKRFLDTAETDKFREYFRARLAHFALYVEDVAEAERDIKRQITGSRVAEVGARKEIVERNVSKLESRGFEVITKPVNKSSRALEPIKVDVENKVVEIIENHPAFIDVISIGNEQLAVRYVEWDISSKGEVSAVRWANDGTIEINTRYPLFGSRRYGEVFKKTLVLMLVLSRGARSPQDLLSRTTKELQQEFQDLI